MRKDYNLEKRKYVIAAAVLTVVAIFIIRLFSLQVGDNDYKRYADSNAFQRKVLYPSRGFIYDRNGELLEYRQRYSKNVYFTYRVPVQTDAGDLSNT